MIKCNPQMTLLKLAYLLILPLLTHTSSSRKVLVSFESGARASPLDLSASLQPLGVQIKHSSLADGLAILEGPVDAVELAAHSLPGTIEVELDEPRDLHACDSNCCFEDHRPSSKSKETIPWGIEMVQADHKKAAGPESLLGTNVWVCIIDTGVYNKHKDLIKNNITGCSNANCNNVAFNETSIAHGTHVAGTIAGYQGNNYDTVGVIPKGANIYAINLEEITIANGVMGMLTCEMWLDRVKAQNNDPAARMVITMSYGGQRKSSVEERVAKRLYERGDILLVASSGNSQLTEPFRIQYPAGYPHIITVGAVDCKGQVAAFSSQYADVELSAPGVWVYSTVIPTVLDVPSFAVAAGKSKSLPFYSVRPVVGSEQGSISAMVIDCKDGTAKCRNAKGKICIIARSKDVDDSCKLSQALASGCAGLLITSEWEPICAPFEGRSIISGSCVNQGKSYIPVATLSKSDGDRLRALVAKGPTKGALKVSQGSRTTTAWHWSGTSMAAPAVTGVAARIWSEFPRCRNENVRRAMQQGAWHRGQPGRNKAYGFGIVQAVNSRKALAAMDCARAV